MSRVQRTSVDMAQAEIIADALAAYVAEVDQRVAICTLAQVLAEYRETILSCAMVRMEREFKLVARTVPPISSKPKP